MIYEPTLNYEQHPDYNRIHTGLSADEQRDPVTGWTLEDKLRIEQDARDAVSKRHDFKRPFMNIPTH